MRQELSLSDTRPQLADESAFAVLLERHRRQLHLHCYRMLGSFDDAEDLVQERLLRAWRGRSEFDGRSGIGTGLYASPRMPVSARSPDDAGASCRQILAHQQPSRQATQMRLQKSRGSSPTRVTCSSSWRRRRWNPAPPSWRERRRAGLSGRHSAPAAAFTGDPHPARRPPLFGQGTCRPSRLTVTWVNSALRRAARHVASAPAGPPVGPRAVSETERRGAGCAGAVRGRA